MTRKTAHEKKWLMLLVVLTTIVAIYLIATPRTALVGGNSIIIPSTGTSSSDWSDCTVSGQGTPTVTIKCGYRRNIVLASDGEIVYGIVDGYHRRISMKGMQKLIVDTGEDIDDINLRYFKGTETEIHGGSHKDYIVGSSKKDIIYGDGGYDFIEALGGDDEIYGGKNEDTIDGGEGNDYIRGGENDDIINGDQGNDFICGDAGIDKLNGNTGIDYLYGGPDTANTDVETILNAGGDAGDKAYGDMPYLPTQPQDTPSGCIPTTNCHVDGPTQSATINPCAIGAKPVHTVTADQTWVPPTTGTGTTNPVTGTGATPISPEI